MTRIFHKFGVRSGEEYCKTSVGGEKYAKELSDIPHESHGDHSDL